MIHEDAVLELHPAAHEFQPVKGGLARNKLFGWTFKVPEGRGNLSVHYGWVTFDGEAARTLVRHQGDAEKNLKAYLRNRSGIDVPTVGILEGGL